MLEKWVHLPDLNITQCIHISKYHSAVLIIIICFYHSNIILRLYRFINITYPISYFAHAVLTLLTSLKTTLFTVNATDKLPHCLNVQNDWCLPTATDQRSGL